MWTLVHLGAGFAAGAVGVSFGWSMIAAVAYEAIEQYVERTEWGREFFQSDGPEGWENVAVDLIVFAGGHWVGNKAR